MGTVEIVVVTLMGTFIGSVVLCLMCICIRMILDSIIYKETSFLRDRVYNLEKKMRSIAEQELSNTNKKTTKKKK